MLNLTCRDAALSLLRFSSPCPESTHVLSWVLEYYTLILFLVLVSDYSSFYLKSIYFFFRVYSKAKFQEPQNLGRPPGTFVNLR